jgi:para-aminobenzoate synthetase/4-amino-4-deoxychorismate lyase
MLFNAERPFALFENQLDPDVKFPFELFFDPIEEIKTYKRAEVSDRFNQIQDLSKKGYFLAGFVDYDALTDSAAITIANDPLVHFYAFTERRCLSLVDFENRVLPLINTDRRFVSNYFYQGICKQSEPLVVHDFQVNETFESYQKKINKIKEYQRQGDTYQVNFTMKNRFKWQGVAFDFFRELKKYQKVSMAAFFHFDKDICSYSPELFIRKDSDIITSKPMKGTAPRGKDSAEDELLTTQMRQDTKTMSENLMIVDLIRNDLGRIALPGTVTVPKLFEVESYATLHQMTSTVQAQVDPALKFAEIMRALFPCGSITGAPKKSTMNIIRELEAEPRQLYTGALGYILPSGDFVFNVAIRTLVLSKNESGLNEGEMGIGSGIIYESDTVKEWEECLLKAKFIKMINSPIQLIETFRYDAESESFLRLQLHLQRLSQSAAAFGFNFPIDNIKEELNNLQKQLSTEQVDHFQLDQLAVEHAFVPLPVCDKKVRLLLYQNGAFQLTHSSVETAKQTYKVVCCKVPIYKRSVFQRHKTTVRDFYENVLKKAVAQGYDEILFFNEDENCVEASRHNVIIKKGENLLTPPITDGALPGVFRQSLFLDKTISISEKSFGWEELISADEIFLCNSVRGLVRSEILPVWIED